MSGPFKMKGFSGFGNSPAKQTKPSPVKTTGHGVEEEHGHYENGKVDPRTLSNRYSEFNKKQEEKGYPTKVVTIKDGKRGWSWSNKPNEFHPMISTEGERTADLAEYSDPEKEGGKGVVTSDKSDVTRKAIAREAGLEDNEKSKKELLEEAGKKTNIFNRLFTSKKALESKARAQDLREIKNQLVSQAASKESGDEYQEQLQSLVNPEITEFEEEQAKQRKLDNPEIKYVGQ
jgi:hypothetical protein